MVATTAAGTSQSGNRNDKKRKLSAINSNNNTPPNTSQPNQRPPVPGTSKRNTVNPPNTTSSSHSKRAKNTTKTSVPPPRPSIPHTLTTATSLLPDDHDGTKALNALQQENRYNVQIHSVLSSSKMQKKVTSVLRHLHPSSSTTTAATTTTGQSDDSSSSTSAITVLRARASDAGKLVSIAEIVKREIEKEAEGKDAAREGVWYQYILIGEELQERPRNGDGSVLVEETVLSQDVGGGEDGEQVEEEAEDDFEIMKTRFERAIEGKPLVRGVPIMSLFLSRVSVLELKRRCGEQTNSSP